jgi:hypothetical protein
MKNWCCESQMRDYFKKKSDAIDGKKEGSEADKKDLLPDIM